MRLCRKVHNDIEAFLSKESVHRLSVCNVALYKSEILTVHDRLQSLKVACVRKRIERNDSILRMLLQFIENEIAADKARSSRY